VRAFIDCGGHSGSSVRKFRQTRDPNCEVVTFEPNPLYTPCYRGFERHRLIRAAVWTEDGEADFYLGPWDGDGSSLLREKTTGSLDRDRPIRVATVDLSSWILARGSSVILKLDIEGAEYDVLDKMLADGSTRFVSELLVEWHWAKVGVSEARHRDVLERWNATGIPVAEWDANGW
jgi:FkbM family methyltransferase